MPHSADKGNFRSGSLAPASASIVSRPLPANAGASSRHRGGKDLTRSVSSCIIRDVEITWHRVGIEEGGNRVANRDALYIISVAARLVDMHPSTLRKYERVGFLEPSRLGGKLRLYSVEDITRLRQIKYLVEERGVNIAGIEMALELTDGLLQLHEALCRETGRGRQADEASATQAREPRRRPAGAPAADSQQTAGDSDSARRFRLIVDQLLRLLGAEPEEGTSPRAAGQEGTGRPTDQNVGAAENLAAKLDASEG